MLFITTELLFALLMDTKMTTYIFMVNNTNIVLYNRTDWSNNFRITLRYTKSK